MLPIDLKPFLAIRRMTLEGSTVVLEASSVAPDGRCPDCGTVASRVHGRFVRRPVDLPWRGCTVRLAIAVTRQGTESKGPSWPNWAASAV
ncbi:MAG: transposase family protein [Chloroflexota bacterium]|nr:MAG: transposase family protein [Chloroflexota bacterium]